VAANPGDSSSVAKALASTTNWASSTEGDAIGNDLTKNNSTGFTALPGSYRSNYEGFGYVGCYGFWWSSSESYAYGTCYRRLFYDLDDLDGGDSYEESGFSVRLVRD
jgi:uncharacterized protein (TIGR02145 family)